MTKLHMNRREALMGGAALGAVGYRPALAQETPRRGGTLTVQVASDPRFLCPALRGSFNITNLAANVVGSNKPTTRATTTTEWMWCPRSSCSASWEF